MKKLQVNFTEEQMDFLHVKGDETGVSKGAYLRMVLHAHMQKEYQGEALVEKRVHKEPSAEFQKMCDDLIELMNRYRETSDSATSQQVSC